MQRALAAWAGVVHRHRRVVLAGAAITVVAAMVGLSAGADYNGNNSVPTESSRASDLIGAELPHGVPSFTLVASSATLTVDDPRFRGALSTALAPLASDARVTGVTFPFAASGSVDAQRVSADRHHALVTVAMVDNATATYRQVRARISSPTLQLLATGSAPVQNDYNRLTDADAARGERLSIPFSLILLLLVFGSVVAALLPLAVALFSTLGGLALLVLITRAMDVDSSASNVTIFLGLGLGIDYSLFIVSRFREELRRGGGVEAALRVAYATAGTAITVSGLTVAIGFSGLLFFTHTWMFSFGLAVVAVVLLSVLAALVLLPALLSLLGGNVDRGRWRRHRRRADEEGMWHRLALAVMRHPVAVLVPSVVVLLLPLSSFLQIKTGTDHLTALPQSAQSRQAAELITAQFPATAQTSVVVVLHRPHGNVADAEVADLSRRLAAVPGVLRVEPPVAGSDIAVLRVDSGATERSVTARDLVGAVRAVPGPRDAEKLVTGPTAADMDFVAYINSRVPVAIGFVVLMTYVVLFLLFGSVLLPLKAVVMNLLSITTSFGALTWVFVQGHLSGLLGFTPAPIDPVLPVILFCVLFGLSMDYEVFLLTRIQEEYHRIGDTRRAIAAGLERNGRLVTGAALIMVVVTGCFGFADVVVVKIIGLGAALAILLDATLVRALVVPAAMCLMGDANWWAPRGLLTARRRLGAVVLRRAPASPAP